MEDCSRPTKKACLTNMAVSFNMTSLDVDVVFFILDRLFEPIDHLRFAAVCKEWRRVAKHYNLITRRWRDVLPMIMVPYSQTESAEGHMHGDGETSSQTNRRVVYSVSEGKVYKNVLLPVPCSIRCCGSSQYGWVATIDREDQPMIITLTNPFAMAADNTSLRKAATIRLPPLEFEAHHMRHINNDHYERNPYENYVQKVIFSADPNLSPDNYVVLAIYCYDDRLAFTKAGQNYWIRLKTKEQNDAVFHKGKIYTREYGMISLVDLETLSSMTLVPVVGKQLRLFEVSQSYFVESTKGYFVESTKGCLWYVEAVPIENEMGILGFKVYNLLVDDILRVPCTACQVVEVESIGDETLFVSRYGSFCVLASNFAGCKPNCIYYINDHIGTQSLEGKPQPCAMGIFNLEDKTVTPVHFPNPNWPGPIQPAVWMVPPFNGLCRS